jgi:Domain of unknown function (DUF4224)
VFLTPAEMAELTGYRRYTKQRVWLAAAGIHFYTAVSGRPVVLKEHLIERRISPRGSQTNQRLRLAPQAVPKGA